MSAAERVRSLISIYSAPMASAAALLCDRHDPLAVAYTVVSSDLTPVNVTYGELRSESERLAAALSDLGLGIGDRIATLMGKSRSYLVTVLAIWRLGAVHVPLFTAFAPPAIAMRLNASAARLVICDAAQRAKLMPGNSIPEPASWRVAIVGAAQKGDLTYDDLLRSGSPLSPAAATGGNAPIIEIYTSGTTGTPKGVVVPLRALASFQVYAEYGLGLQPEDVFWNAADPGWAYGLYYGILASFCTGVRSIFVEGGFSPETALAVLERFAVTNLAAAPTVYRALRASGPMSSTGFRLRCASSAGEPLTPEVNEWAVGALGVAVRDHYGQTETGMLINNHQHPELERPLRPGSMGLAMPGWKATILKSDADDPASSGDIGRVAIDLTESPLAWFSGYRDDAARSAEKFTVDGRWYITGDIGRTDDDGFFYFTARDDDVIIMAGYRIGPFEVESVILTHPAVSECAVVAVPDEIRGEVLETVVVLRPGYASSQDLTAEIQATVKNGYAAHAYPRQVHYVESLPKTPSGKIQRFLIRKQLRDRTAPIASGP
jgi:acetyl-CoA synthetase